MTGEDWEIQAAKDRLILAGYVIHRAKSYQQAQERQRVAEVRVFWAEDDVEHSRRWALECLNRERYLADRCTFLYGAARAHGATEKELKGSIYEPSA